MRKRIIISKDENRARELHQMCTCREDLNDEVDIVRKNFDIDVHFLAENNERAINAWGSFYIDDALRIEVEKILIKLNISKGWTEGVLLYVIDGLSGSYDDVVWNPEGLIIDVNVDDFNDVVWYVGPETTSVDIDNARKFTIDLRGGKAPRNRDFKNAERDQKIFRMARHGKTITDIYYEIKSEFDEDLDYGAIKKIVSESYTKYKIPSEIRPIMKTREED